MIEKKICMLGAFAVGKTSLVRRFVTSLFSEQYHTTIGVTVDKKSVTVDGETVTLVLWDLYGEDDFQKLRRSYLRGSSGYSSPIKVISAGNSHLRNGSFLGELSARGVSLRLTILGRYIYGDDAGNLLVRNSRGTIKLDFFLTKRLYWFASAYSSKIRFKI